MNYSVEGEETEKKGDMFTEQKAIYELIHQHGVLHGLERSQ